MEGMELIKIPTWQPLSRFGIEHWFLGINYSTIIHTWIILGVMTLILIPVYLILTQKPGLIHFIITSFVNYFVNLIKTSLGYFDAKHFVFIGGLFTVILLCNILSIFPGIKEPTEDVNTTLAFGIISFLYIQYYSIKAHGIVSYIKEYFEPFFPMFPLNVIGKIASIVSISFRLFGNIFGGVIIAKIYYNAIQGSWWAESAGLLSGINFIISLFFGLFEGALQAFVFTMLTVTYLSIALQSHSPEISEPQKSQDNQDELQTGKNI